MRSFVKHFKADMVLRKKIDSGQWGYAKYRKPLQWALKKETVFKKRKKGIQKKRPQKQTLRTARSNILSLVCGKISKKVLERFFKNPSLRSLFLRYAPKIKEEVYNYCENRHNNRVDCKRVSSEQSTSFQSVKDSDEKARSYNQAQEDYHKEVDRLIEFGDIIASGKASYPI